MNKQLNLALENLKKGYSVIPLGRNKKPMIDWKPYQKLLATEQDLQKWWNDNPEANVGIVTGEISGITVIDVDDGADYKQFPRTMTVKTGNNGYHLYYKFQKDFRNKTGIMPNVDVRGVGGYVVAAGSVHENGNVYELIDNMEPQSFPIEMFSKQKKKADWEDILVNGAKEGTRNQSVTQLIGHTLSIIPPNLWDTIAWKFIVAWNEDLTKPLPISEIKSTFDSIAQREISKKEDGGTKEVPRIIAVPAPERHVGFEDWQKEIRLSFPDLVFPAEVAMSILSQILIKDVVNPFALVLVDVPSSGKTITINFFDQIEGLTYSSDKFTPAAFVSAAANKKREELAEVDLLPRLRNKMFLIRDLATLFSKRDDDLNESLGILTRVLDGEGLVIDTGSHGRRGYQGDFLFMILAASTPIPPRVWRMMGSLGSRLFFLNMNTKPKTEKQLSDQITHKQFKKMEKQCQEATNYFLQGLWHGYQNGVEWDPKKDSESLKLIIARCSMLLARLRGVVQVWNDTGSDGEKYEHTVPVVEMADRINQLFYNLCRGHALIQGRKQISESDLKLIAELTINSAPTIRAHLFNNLLKHNGKMKTSQVMEALKCSRPTALKEMAKLNILEISDLWGQDSTYDNTETTIQLKKDLGWFLSDEFKRIRGSKVSGQQQGTIL